jgi:quinol monooxygenase YgiN
VTNGFGPHTSANKPSATDPVIRRKGEKDMPIAALVTMTPKPGRRAELQERLTEVLAKVRTEPGNLLAVVLDDPNQPDKVIEFAIFRDEAAIEDHWKAEHSVTMGPVLGELQSEPYEARRFTPSGGSERGCFLVLNFVDTLLASRQAFLGHLDTELKDDPEATMATVRNPPTYAIAHSVGVPGTERMVAITDHDGVREFYAAADERIKPTGVRVVTNVSSDWYDFMENVPTRHFLREDRYVTMNSVVLVPRAGDFIQGEFLWERSPEEGEPQPQDVPEELGSRGVIPTVRLRNAKVHERFLDAVRAGRLDDAMAFLDTEPLWAARSYAPDAGPAPLIKAEGRDQVRALLEAWTAVFDVERVSVLTRVATDWYVFADELYTVTVKSGPLTGKRREFRQAIFYPVSPDGVIQGAMGYGTDLVEPSSRSDFEVGRISYARDGFADTLCEPSPSGRNRGDAV